MKPAASLLLAFLVAAVPVDGWLTRRSLRRGRRSRWGALRYPVLVAAATLACWGLASAHAGSRHRMLRVDVVESGPDGHGRATTHLLVLRGQAGPFDVSIAEGSLDGVHDASRWMNDLVPAQHRAAEDPIEALRSVQIDIPPWKPVHVLAHWTPPRMPFPGDAGPCGTLHVGDADVVLRSEACGVAGPFSGPFPGGLLRADALPPRGDPAGDAPERIRLAAAHLRAHENRSGWWQQEESPPRLVVAHGSRLGPRITVDGIDTDLAPTVTLVRHFGNRAP